MVIVKADIELSLLRNLVSELTMKKEDYVIQFDKV